MLFSRAAPLLLSTSMVPRLSLQRAALAMTTSTDVTTFVKNFWGDIAAAGQTKDAGKIESTFGKYFRDDCVLIRPSGNPLDLAGFKGIMGSPDIIVEKDEVISVDDVKELAGGNAAVAGASHGLDPPSCG